MTDSLAIANDNFVDTGDMRQHLAEITPTALPNALEGGEARPARAVRRTGSLGFVVIILWAASLIWTSLGAKAGTSYMHAAYLAFPVFLSSLALGFIGKIHQSPLVSSVGMFSTLAAMSVCGLALNFGLNLHIGAGTLLALAAGVSVCLAVYLNDKTALVLSITYTLVWAGLAVATKALPGGYWLLPAIAATQVFAAIRWPSKPALILASLSLLSLLIAGLYSCVTSGALSAVMAVSLLAGIGLVWNRIGKSMQDYHRFGGLFMTNFGLVVAAFAAIGLQDYWLNPDKLPWQRDEISHLFSYRFLPMWLLVSVLSITAIFITGVLRVRKRKQGWFGVMCMTMLSTFIPLSLILEHTNLALKLAPYLSIDGKPGYILAGIVTGMAMGMLVNGLHRARLSMVVMAFCILCAEAAFIGQFLMQAPDNLTLFALSALISALSAALFARPQFRAPSMETTR